MEGTPGMGNVKPLVDWQALDEYLALLFADGKRHEARLLCTPDVKVDGKIVEFGDKVAGMFDDAISFRSELKRYLDMGLRWQVGAYATPDPVTTDCPRLRNRLSKTMFGDHLTRADDIPHRRTLKLDIDPRRAEGMEKQSSSDAEKESARQLLLRILGWLKAKSFPDPWIVADSGNGWHALWQCDLPTDSHLPDRFLKMLWQEFDDHLGAPHVIDTGVSDPCRIWKLYGCLATKGQDTAERPHRHSRIHKVVGGPTVQEADLVALLGPEPVRPARTHGKMAASGAWDVPKLLAMLSQDRVEDYKTWITVGMALRRWAADAHVDDASAEAWWTDWSSRGSTYGGEDECAAKWQSFDPGKEGTVVTLGTVCSMASEDASPEEMRACRREEGGPDPEDPILAWGSDSPEEFHQAVDIPNPKRKLRWIEDKDLPEEHIKWLWFRRIPLGGLTILSGCQGDGKTYLAAWLCAQVTKGGLYPCGESGNFTAGSILYWTAEDSLSATIKRRIRACGADMSKVAYTTGTALEGQEDGEPKFLDLDENLDLVEEALKAHPEVKLVVLDPVTASDIDIVDNKEVRRLLTKWNLMGMRLGVTIVAITHFRKPGTKGDTGAEHKRVYSVLGCNAWTAVPRSSMDVSLDPNDPLRRLLEMNKMNLEQMPPILAYHLIGAKFDEERVEGVEPTQELAHVEFEDEPLKEAPTKKDGTLEHDKLWLAKALCDAPLWFADIEQMAVEACLSKRRLYSAKEAIGLVVTREGVKNSRVAWSLPGHVGKPAGFREKPQETTPPSESTQIPTDTPL